MFIYKQIIYSEHLQIDVPHHEQADVVNTLLVQVGLQILFCTEYKILEQVRYFTCASTSIRKAASTRSIQSTKTHIELIRVGTGTRYRYLYQYFVVRGKVFMRTSNCTIRLQQNELGILLLYLYSYQYKYDQIPAELYKVQGQKVS